MAKNTKKTSNLKSIKPSTSAGSTVTAEKVSTKTPKAVKVIGTIASFTPLGRSAKIGATAAKVASKVAGRISAKESREVGMRAAREVAANTKPGRLGSAGNKPFSKRTNPKKPVTGKDITGGIKSSTYGVSKVEGRTAPRTFEQRLGSQKAGDTKRTKKIAEAETAAERAAKPVIAKAKVKTAAKTAAAAGAAGYGIGEFDRKNKGKNKKRR